MAVTLGDALIKIKADNSDLGKGLGSAEKQTTIWADSVGGKVAALMGGAIVAGVGAAVVGIGAIGTAGFNMAKDFNRATNNIVSDFNLTEKQGEAAAEAIKETYRAGFGDSMDEVGQAVGQVLTGIGKDAENLSGDQLSQLTQEALALADAFEVDVGESSRVAGLLIRNGIAKDADEAFDIITAGYQQGLDVSGDFLDTLGEYSDDFGDMGMTGGEVLGFLNKGLEAGALNTDKLGDAMNEFGVNLRDPGIGEGLNDIDSGLGDIFDQFQDGEVTEREALEGMVERLNAIEDPIARDQAGVMLFRSTWEDLGETALLALGNIEDGVISTEGATDSLIKRYDNFDSVWDAIKRRGSTALIPLGNSLLNIANSAMPLVEKAMAAFEKKVLPIFENVAAGVDEFFKALSSGYGVLSIGEFLDNFIDEDSDLFDPMWDAVEMLDSVVKSIITFITENSSTILAVLGGIATAFVAFQALSGIVALVGGLGTAWAGLTAVFAGGLPAMSAIVALLGGPITLVIAAVAAAVGLMAAAWNGNWFGIRDTITAVWDEKLKPAFEAIGAFLSVAIPLAIATVKSKWETDFLPVLETVWTYLSENLMPIFNALSLWMQETLPLVIAELKTVWDEQFIPMLDAAWVFIRDSLMPVLQSMADIFTLGINIALTALEGIWTNILKPALTDMYNKIKIDLQPVLETLGGYLNDTLLVAWDAFKTALANIKTGLEALATPFEALLGFLEDIKTGLENVELPDWMKPGSPPPLYYALNDINRAMSNLNQTSLPELATNMANVSMAGAGLGGLVNVDQSSRSFSSSDSYSFNVPDKDTGRMMANIIADRRRERIKAQLEVPS